MLKLKAIQVIFAVGKNDSYWLNSANKYNAQLSKLGIEVKLNVVENGGHVLREIKGDRFMEFMDWVIE